VFLSWSSDIKAGLTYFLGVFVVAFVLGTIRTLIVAPRVGATIAVLLETPIILVVSWSMSRWCAHRFDVRAATDRALMGAIALTVLMLAEFALAVVLFRRSSAEYAASFVSIPGAIGLFAQFVFAAIPWLQWRVAAWA
jgi:hypothetical protein